MGVALPGLAGWENPGMSGPVWFTVITLHVDAVDLHQSEDGGSQQVIAKPVHSDPVSGEGRLRLQWMEI